MNHTVTLTVPMALEASTMVIEHVQQSFTLLHGGCSSWPVIGHYRMNSGEIVKEMNMRISSFIPKGSFNLGALFDLARSVAIRLNQESVLLEIDGEAHFIKGR